MFSRGTQPKDDISGGGAGGSLLINTATLKGMGTIDVTGGDGGMTSGGGGSGGSAAIYFKESTLLFSSALRGGRGKRNGASGILYLQRTAAKNEYSKLILDNGGLSIVNTSSILVCDPKRGDYIFSEIQLLKASSLSMISCGPDRPMTLITNKVTGDTTGWLVINKYHDVYVGVTGLILPSLELEFNIRVNEGAAFSAPPMLTVSDGIQVDLSGSLDGVTEILIAEHGKLQVQYPGHTGYRKTPEGGSSTLTFNSFRVKNSGVVKTLTSQKVLLDADSLQVDYGGYLDPNIPLSTNKRVIHQSGIALGRQDCPHGYEVVAWASPTVYNPCGVGKHIFRKSNVSYIVSKNVSRSLSQIAWRNNSGILESFTNWTTTYEIFNETHYNVTYYIACDYADFVLLPGQSCTLKPANYSYNTLEIQGGAKMNFEASVDRNTISNLTVSKLLIYSGGSVLARTSDFENAVTANPGNGGSYGGHGGGDVDPDAVYGPLEFPVNYGSIGGGNADRRGKGGGALRINTQEFINDGLVDASGGKGTAGAGGGSGGSLQIRAASLAGSGIFQVRGGDGADPVSGGGGGRIGVVVTQGSSSFHGSYDASGGGGSKGGSSGTVFVRDQQGGGVYDTLILQGQGHSPVILPNSSMNSFHEVRVGNSAVFSTYSKNLVVKSLVTDGTGKIIVPTGSRTTIADVQGERKEINCDLEIEPGGSLFLHSRTVFNGPGTPSVLLRGLMDAAEPVVGKSTFFKVDPTGVLHAKTFQLEADAEARVSSSAKIMKRLTQKQFHLDSLSLQTNASLRFTGTNVTFHSTIIRLDKDSTVGHSSDSSLKRLIITANDMIVDSNAKITADSGGYLGGGPGVAGSSGHGCGHGGKGAGAKGGDAYGSVFEPSHYGSGNSGRGGGIVLLNVSQTLTLHGTVTAGGAGDASGGASGGSVLLYAGTLNGHGQIQANGGSGLGASGGGSGGRIALYITDKSSFTGRVTAYGGCGGSCGAAGTVFIREYVIGLPLNTTIVDNGERVTEAKTMIMHEHKQSYTMRMLKLVNGARLEVASVPNVVMKIEIRQLEGDRTGSFHVHANQTLTLGVGKAVSLRPFVFPWAMTVDNGAVLNLSPRLFITQTQATPSLYLAGRLVGGQEINVGQNALVVIAKTGIIGTRNEIAGRYSFRSLKVSGGGRMRFESDVTKKIPVEISSVSIDVGFGGILEGRYLQVRTPLLTIAFSGTLRADGLGHVAGTGPGVGMIQSLSGGSYGGCGGGITLGECHVYGSLYKTTEFGSGGGTTSPSGNLYGAGGGIIEVQAATVIVDGIVSSNGGNADNTTTGAGSGGSVDISVTKLLIGRGRFETQGGDGRGQTGSGGGGRISVLVTGIYKFDGTFTARGGNSSSKGGSPGTVYIQELRAGFRSKKLLLDNQGVLTQSSLPVLLNETSVESYHFNELQLSGKVTLHLEKDMLADKLITDLDSIIHVQDNVIFTAEPLAKYLNPLCSFHVDQDGEIRVPDTVTFLGSNNNFAGTLTGILDMVIGENRTFLFSPSARTARFIDGKYTFKTERGKYRFSSLRVKNNGLLAFENARLKQVPLTVGRLELNFGAVLQGSWLDIKASDVIVHSGATIDLSGQGHESEAGTGAGGQIQSVGAGAGHGGFGGLASGGKGGWYGSAYNPNDTGSGGGSSASGAGGAGGGHLHLVVIRSLRIEGTVTVDGEAGPVLNSAGGSAGSIWISAKDVLGNGLISSEGGSGNRQGGGGSGGRIALYLQAKMSFEGVLRSRGGNGGGVGASGTVYIQDNNNRIPRKRLWIENVLLGNDKPTTVLSEPDKTSFSFSELKLLGNTRFEIANLKKQKLTINVATFTSDGVGEVAVRANQTMYTEVLEAKESHLTLTTNVYVEQGANLVLASNLTVDGATLTLDGKLSNVRNLVVESGSAVKFGITSQTTLMSGKDFVFQSTPGMQQFASVTLKSGSDFGAPLNLRINVGRMDMKNGVLLRGKFIDIKAQALLIGRGATLTTNSGISDRGSGGFSGQSSGSGGSGAGHGSAGGSGGNNLKGGIPYGTIYTPDQPGRPGGDGTSLNTAGKGGGVIRITADVVENDGFITANGGHATPGTNSGGGSGGSIFVKVAREFTGTGLLSADGGRGDGPGGCGAGGRVSVDVTSLYRYRGKLQAVGGLSTSSGKPGGPGTVYIRDIRNKLPYNQLHIDNQGQEWANYVTLNESSIVYDFNEVYMYRKAAVRMIEVPTSNAPQELKISKLIGDQSGLMHIYNNQRAVIEVVEAQRTTTKTPVNIKIESGGEAVMATTVYIVGNGAVALDCNGTLSGILNLYVAQNRVVKLHRGADTSRKDEEPGTFIFSNLKLFSGSSLTMEDELEMRMYVGFVNVKYGSSLSAHHFSIFTSKLDVETGGLLSAAGDNDARKAAPSSETSLLPVGAGAGHASNGGSGYGGPGGAYHGSLLNPVESGRRGGSGSGGGLGGTGGGYIQIEAGNELINDGTITAAGESAGGGTGGGGGSGGSLLFRTDIFDGWYKCAH